MASADWTAQADAITEVLRRNLPRELVAAYVHGSAALGGWVPGASDLDYLAIVLDDAQASWSELGDRLAEVTGAPIELSLIPESLARRPRPPWPFFLHLTTDGSDDPARRRVLRDHGDGDTDLLMHLAVVREHGIALHGPEPRGLLAPVDRAAIRAYLHDELAWGASHADARYAVLNACRAWHYAATDQIVSKLAGGRLARTALPRHAAVIAAALAAQTEGRDLGPLSEDGWALVGEVQGRLAPAAG